MKTPLRLAVLALVTACSFSPAALLAQGSLTPPGAPAPTMKTLTQVEPRIAITNSDWVTISQPGSYYLTTNLTVTAATAITITTNNVTLDLNGFTVTSTAPSANGNGISLSMPRPDNITILNGIIRSGITNNGSGVYSGPGFSYGIYYTTQTPRRVRVSNVTVSGCYYHGINLGMGEATLVESCLVQGASMYGISAATVRSSSALECGNHAISANMVSDSRGQSLGAGNGVSGDTVQNCYGIAATGNGISATTCINSYGWSTNNGYGIITTLAQNCYGYSFSGIGISATSVNNCYGNTTSGPYGINTITAVGSFGYSGGSGRVGLYANTAATCCGSCPGNTAIQATIGNGCIAYAGTNNISYKYNMP